MECLSRDLKEDGTRQEGQRPLSRQMDSRHGGPGGRGTCSRPVRSSTDSKGSQRGGSRKYGVNCMWVMIKVWVFILRMRCH